MKKNKLYMLVLILFVAALPMVVFAEQTCPLGEDVTKDLSGALKIIRIVAPLLVIGLTFKEGVTALFRGDSQGSGKKFVMKLLKRLLAAVVLFAIPVIVDAFMQLLNVWDDTGRCTFDGAGYNTSVQTQTTTETCEQRCGHIGDNTGRNVCLANCKTTTTSPATTTNAITVSVRPNVN